MQQVCKNSNSELGGGGFIAFGYYLLASFWLCRLAARPAHILQLASAVAEDSISWYRSILMIHDWSHFTVEQIVDESDQTLMSPKPVALA